MENNKLCHTSWGNITINAIFQQNVYVNLIKVICRKLLIIREYGRSRFLEQSQEQAPFRLDY